MAIAMAGDLSPYFEALSRGKRVCPKCLERLTWIEPSGAGNPNVAAERCRCGYFQGLVAPKGCEVEWDPSSGPWRKPGRKANIIRFEDIKRGR